MKNIRKIMMVAGAVAMATIISIGSGTNAEAKHKKDWKLTTKEDVTLNNKESKKYVKACKIKFKYDTQKNTFELTSFKKNKYAPVSKKIFKKYYVCDVIAVDGKKYDDSNISKCLDDNNKCDLGSKTAEKILSKIGKHKVKLKVCFGGNKNWGKYGRTFYWNGTMNVKESCINLGNTYKNHKHALLTHFSKFGGWGPEEVDPEAFSIGFLATNVNAKLDMTIKYVFDKNHISSKDLNELAKDNNTTTDAIIAYIKQISLDLTFNKSFDVKAWDYKKARFNFYTLKISDYSKYKDFDDNVHINSFDITMFKPEVTYTVTSVKTGKVLKNVSTTKVISEI